VSAKINHFALCNAPFLKRYGMDSYAWKCRLGAIEITMKKLALGE